MLMLPLSCQFLRCHHALVILPCCGYILQLSLYLPKLPREPENPCHVRIKPLNHPSFSSGSMWYQGVGCGRPTGPSMPALLTNTSTRTCEIGFGRW